MPNIKSAKKRVLTNDKKAIQNQSAVSEVKTAMRNLNTLITNGDKAGAQEAYKKTAKLLDQLVSAGRMHINTAANKKSGFAKRINALA